MINRYLADFDNTVNNLDFIISSDIQKRKMNEFLCIIEGKLFFENGVLDILEVVKITDNQTSKKKYKYHYRNHNNEMIFRYDNAPHHQDVTTFPHHKHLPDKLIDSSEPDILLVLAEIKTLLE